MEKEEIEEIKKWIKKDKETMFKFQLIADIASIKAFLIEKNIASKKDLEELTNKIKEDLINERINIMTDEDKKAWNVKKQFKDLFGIDI